MAVACEWASAVVVLRHLSGFDYIPLRTEDRLAVNTRPHEVGGADFDQDGYVDLVVACYGNPSGGSMDYIQNAGDGTFGPVQSTYLGNAADSLVVVDLNGDQRPDVAVSLFEDGVVKIFLNNRCAP